MHMTALERSEPFSTRATKTLKPKIKIKKPNSATIQFHNCCEQVSRWLIMQSAAKQPYYNYHVDDHESICIMHYNLKGNKTSGKPTPHRPNFHKAMHDSTETPSFTSHA